MFQLVKVPVSLYTNQYKIFQLVKVPVSLYTN